MTIRMPLLATAAALALLGGGAALAGEGKMEHGQGMQMQDGHGGEHGGKGQHHGADGAEDDACPRAEMMGDAPMMSDASMMGQGMKGSGKGMHGGKAMMARGHMGFPPLLSADDVTARFERMIAGNKRLMVAMVEPGGDFSFRVDITTLDGSLVHKLLVDRRDGRAWELD